MLAKPNEIADLEIELVERFFLFAVVAIMFLEDPIERRIEE